MEKDARKERSTQHHDADEDRALAADALGDHAHGHIRDDGRDGADHQHQGKVALQLLFGVTAESRGDGVVAEEPEEHAGQDEQQAAEHGPRHFAARVRYAFVLVGRAGGPVGGLAFSHAGRFPDLPEQHGHTDGHHQPQHKEYGGIAGRIPGDGKDHHRQQHQHAAHGAHQVDDGVALAAQGLGCDVRHQGHGGAAVGGHGNEQQPQADEEQQGVVLLLCCGHDGEAQKRQNGAAQYVRHTAADFRAGLVAQLAEQRQHEQRQHVVHGHHDADVAVAHMERVFQDQGDDVVVHLPERADGHECKAHEKGAFVIQLHREKPPLLLLLSL